MDEKTIQHMRERIERCHRLARQTTDDRTAKALLEMAAEGEADLARMLTEPGSKIPVVRI